MPREDDGKADWKGPKPPERSVKRILIYMATSARNLVGLAREAQIRILRALDDALLQDRDPKRGRYGDGGDRRVVVNVLVHGYQLDGSDDLGSMEFEFTLEAGVSERRVRKGSLSYVPGDETVVAQWIRDRLDAAPGAGKPARVDSTMLVFWGHGLGVGTTLTVPTRVERFGGSDAIRRPCLSNIGGFGDSALARQIDQRLGVARGGGRVVAEGALPAESGPPFDILVFDSCLMAGAELAYEYRALARYLVASQTLVDTAPAGPPGLNLGSVVRTFLKDGAWQSSCESKGRRCIGRDLGEVAAEIAELVGDEKSGARQLTAFNLQKLCVDVEYEIRTARDWLEEHRPDREAERLRGQLEAARKAGPEGVDKGSQTAIAQGSQTAITIAADALEGKVAYGEVGIAGLVWLFTRLLNQASFDPEERARIVVAFRSAYFVSVRQFLDLRDLARQVHRVCQDRLLQIAALALVTELAPKEDAFVVAHQVAATLEEKERLSGVSIYCPWFRTHPGLSLTRPFNVTIDHGRYRELGLPDVTGWSDFVFGPLFEASSAERRAFDVPPPSPPSALEVLARLLDTLQRSGVVRRQDRELSGPLFDGDKPSGPLFDGNKPSGPLFDGNKPSGPLFDGDKPSGPLVAVPLNGASGSNGDYHDSSAD
jgi:Clostripain family